jgi:hypothetical protein
MRKLVAPPVIILGIVVVLVMGAILAPAQSIAEYTVIGVLVMILAAVTSIMIHEAGHVLAGWLVGFRFVLWIAGPLCIQAGQFPRLNWNWRQMGLVISIPPIAPALRTRQILFMAGGPAANLLIGHIALRIQNGIGEPVQSGAYTAGERTATELTLILFFYFLGWMSSLFGLINIWPRQLSTVQTDGAWLWALLHHRASPELAEKSIQMAAEYKAR